MYYIYIKNISQITEDMYRSPLRVQMYLPTDMNSNTTTIDNFMFNAAIYRLTVSVNTSVDIVYIVYFVYINTCVCIQMFVYICMFAHTHTNYHFIII